jgi:precorrin-6A synthase
MRQLKLIGIGTGNPDHITVQAINALKQADVVFLTDKGAQTAELLAARREICRRYADPRACRMVEIEDPQRDRGPGDYLQAVGGWHRQRAQRYEQLLQEHLSEDACGAFLIWGDPGLYDSTLRIVQEVAARQAVPFEYEVIPGISSLQALCARHRIALNQVGQPLQITTGRRLKAGMPATDTVVMLDGECAFTTLADPDLDIYWGACLGLPGEILLAGPLNELSGEIQQRRERARSQRGWIMDTYLLRRRPGP